jgi:hypothetical protein
MRTTVSGVGVGTGDGGFGSGDGTGVAGPATVIERRKHSHWGR